VADLIITDEEYERYKPLLFSLGYRMLGSVAEAEDLVQETFLKVYQINDESIENKKAYICKIMTNRCLDVLKSARHQREQYIGPWHPEPLLLATDDPADIVVRKEGLSFAYLRMMEHLSPDERVVFLFKEVYEFSYKEIANILDKKEENCRKLFSRAKQKMSPVDGESLDYETNQSIVLRFIEAFQTQNMTTLLELLHENVTLYSDGGGKVNAAIRPIMSLSNVLALLYGIVKKAPDDFYFEVKNINGQPAIINYMNHSLQSVISFYIKDLRIEEIYISMNPDKLNF
jgi:RNA polymerase sigma-70 factor, ECF subfamily